jgi:Protein of unknown function (DUF2971)
MVRPRSRADGHKRGTLRSLLDADKTMSARALPDPLQYGCAGRFSYHYTRRDTAFEYILPTRQLLASSLLAMRDPLENKQWWRTGGWTYTPEPDVQRVFSAVEASLETTKLLSFTLDVPPEQPESVPAQRFARGYSRPRMWEQYADRHEGVCLVFDRDALHAAVLPGLQRAGTTFFGAVRYSDVDFSRYSQARRLDVDALALARAFRSRRRARSRQPRVVDGAELNRRLLEHLSI